MGNGRFGRILFLQKGRKGKEKKGKEGACEMNVREEGTPRPPYKHTLMHPSTQTPIHPYTQAPHTPTHLHMLTIKHPGAVCHEEVRCVQIPELLGGVLQPFQPLFRAAHLQEGCPLLLHQVGTLVATCSLGG